jgi:hypothetical protein
MRGDCPEQHVCVPDGAGGGWCSFECSPGPEDTCAASYDGPGEAVCGYQMPRPGGGQVNLCVPRRDNQLGRSCTPSPRSAQADCSLGHVCVDAGDGTGWCSFPCKAGEHAQCAAGYTGDGEALCGTTVKLATAAAATQAQDAVVCVVREERALGQSCTVSETDQQGDCPAGHVCLANASGAQTGWCTYACDPASDRCGEGYDGPGRAMCSASFQVNIKRDSGGGLTPACMILCEAASEGLCSGGTCDGTCPDALACEARLVDVASRPPRVLGKRCR